MSFLYVQLGSGGSLTINRWDQAAPNPKKIFTLEALPSPYLSRGPSGDLEASLSPYDLRGPFGYFDDRFYHLQYSQIASVDLRTGSSSMVTTPASFFTPEELDYGAGIVQDFLINRQGTVFVLTGSCQETPPCSLRSFDLASGQSKTWIDRLVGELNPANTAWVLDRFDDQRNILSFRMSMGDGGGAAYEQYELSLATGKWEKVATARREVVCGDEPCKGDPGVILENERYERLIAKPDEECGEFTIHSDTSSMFTDFLLITRNGGEHTIPNAQYLGCTDSSKTSE